MLFEWIIVGSVFFWILMSLWLILMCAMCYNERWGLSLFLLTFGAVGVTLFGDVNVFKLIFHNWQFIPIYLVLGLIWSFVRWLLFIQDVKDAYNCVRIAYLSKKDFDQKIRPNAPYDDKVEWLTYLGDHWPSRNTRPYVLDVLIRSAKDIIPHPDHYKGYIAGWILNWPCSLLSNLFGRLAQRVAMFLFERFKKIYSIIAKRMMRDLDGIEVTMPSDTTVKQDTKQGTWPNVVYGDRDQ